ncbi:MAG: MarR family winged helix-turn-helix transcriptional regulator [Saprospiraceae bacterium]
MPSIDEIIKQKSFESAQQKVLINLVFSGGWAKSHGAGFLKPFNLTWQQFNLMRILRGQKGKAVPLRVLAERMLDPQSNASRLVDKLVEKGLVDRHVCPDDRRQVRLSLSKNGDTTLDNAFIAMRKATEAIGGDLSNDELNQLSDLLDRLRNPRKNNEL